MDTAKIIIRPERVADYATIADIHVRAFDNRAVEALIISLQRHRRAFDPDLSLVAELDGRIVGHALFTPEQMRLFGQTLPVVNLAPIGVDPAHQGQGIGGRLISEGHTIATAKGYRLSVVLGHPTYYPRFGYQQRAYGPSQVVASVNALPKDLLETRNPTSEDVPALQELWRHEESAVDMAIEPGPNLLDWLSPNPAIQATVYTRNGEPVGYTRVHDKEPTKPRVFLARGREAARAMVATLAHNLEADIPPTAYVLPLHPFSASTQAFGQATTTAWNAAMVCPLAPSPFEEYMASVQEGQRPPGRVIWPVGFDLD
jgi:putative acetyltransferase